MFGSNVVDIAVGLMFTFLAISLIASSATEAVSSAMSWRANTLFQGVKDLLNDPQFDGLALQIYNHGLVNGLSTGTATKEADLTAKPSYIDPKLFASALTDVVGFSPGASVQDLKGSIALIGDNQLKTVLNGIVDRTNGKLDEIRGEIASWFDRGMDRVSGEYKRKAQLWSLMIGLAVAVVLNIDAIRITDALWNQPMLLKSLTPPRDGWDAQHALSQLQNLTIPFGWSNGMLSQFFTGWNWLFIVPGWIISGIATLFGAPFWFDSLQKIAQLRGTGSNPAGKPGT